MTRNFGAITCESCKAFFRRNGLKTEQFICPSNGKCDINVMTRRMCRKCRLEKCLAFGMKTNKRQELPVIPVFKTISDYNGINQLESKRIAELLMAYKEFKHPLNNNTNILKIKNWEELILNGFNNICADDKYVLMKYGARDLVLIRSLRHYNRETESFITPIDHDHSLQIGLALYEKSITLSQLSLVG
ncbi:unnamed protein product [Medioppia subpectinata]|uniref:Nuclear receptor domain-containing protein n=1 Tax=Medioppia subpectinata TaxID=1979941 RepID=A0A7R9Q4G6_9ACAR|nr:unnamed protein product [Medioppia subpectinata]CAG2112280.1 unnamed protein product [Medioppia subpectinata]